MISRSSGVNTGYWAHSSMPYGSSSPRWTSANPIFLSLLAKTRSARAPDSHPAQAAGLVNTSGGGRRLQRCRRPRSARAAEARGRPPRRHATSGARGSPRRWRSPRRCWRRAAGSLRGRPGATRCCASLWPGRWSRRPPASGAACRGRTPFRSARRHGRRGSCRCRRRSLSRERLLRAGAWRPERGSQRRALA